MARGEGGRGAGGRGAGEHAGWCLAAGAERRPDAARSSVINLALSWGQAAVVTGCLLGVSVAGASLAGPVPMAGPGAGARWLAQAPWLARVARARWLARVARARWLTRVAAFAREAGLLTGLYALWQLAGLHPVSSPDAALARARWLWHAERLLHLPSEAALQRPLLPHPLLVEAANLYYASLHFPVLLGCLAWLYARRRGEYARVRTTVVLFTACCLLIQFIPVAPPRMLTGYGLVDTGLDYGQSVYGAGLADQLSAMPSVHVGWALLVAVAVIGVVRSRWRWLALAYPAATTLVVVVTANHFWLDGIVAAALLAVVLAAQRAFGAARRPLRSPGGRVRPGQVQPEPGPPGHDRDPAPGGQVFTAGPRAAIMVPVDVKGDTNDQPGPPVLPSRDL